jgi:XTP/dITP diphosphohydrolase
VHAHAPAAAHASAFDVLWLERWGASRTSHVLYTHAGRALSKLPGVRSARYAHDKATDQENIDKLLQAMNTLADRTACFKTIISLQFEGGEYFFEGECSGQILSKQRGSAGFGYDPIFVPDGSTLSFAEMSSAEKNLFSHREKAVRKMLSFLQSK